MSPCLDPLARETMLSTLSIQFVNGLDGDPAIYVQLSQSGECVLFDAGSLENLSNRELLKIRVVAISHTHVDHFIGFDRLIRVNVPHFRTLEVIGPTGIVTNLVCKLRAYNWNLLAPGQLNFIVHEVGDRGLAKAFRLTNDNNFQPIDLQLYKQNVHDLNSATGIQLKTSSNFHLRAVVVDHGTAVLSYCLSMPSAHTVSKSALERLGLRPGPWIGELQRQAATGNLNGVSRIEEREVPTQQLADEILMSRPGERLVYITDMAFKRFNLERITQLVEGEVDLLICESNYVKADHAKAVAKSHLTTYQAALLATVLKSKNLQIFHISNIYAGDLSLPLQEASEAHSMLRNLSPAEFEAALSRELAV